MTQNNKSDGTNKFVGKVSRMYMNIREKQGDVEQTESSIHAAVRKALGKLGLSLTPEAMEAKTRKIAETAIRQARKELRRKYLLEINVSAGKGSYPLPFFPDIKIPNTPENHERWNAFLESLAPKTRVGEDLKTKTVGILWRDGVWLDDLVLAGDMHSFLIPVDITEIKGNLVAPNARVVNKAFTHKVLIRGELHLNRDLLRQDPPPITIEGGIRLIGERRIEAAVTPQLLLKWGLVPDRKLTVRNDVYIFRIKGPVDAQTYHLEGENVLTDYEWMGGKWLASRQTRLAPGMLDDIHARLSRICIGLGLGAGFVAKSESRLRSNMLRILCYLELCLWGRRAFFEQAGDSGADASGRDDFGPVAQVAGYIEELLVLTTGRKVDKNSVQGHLALPLDEPVAEAAGYASQPRAKEDRKSVENDLKTLDDFLEDGVDANDLLGDGLKTARFLLDTFASGDSLLKLRHALDGLAKAYENACGNEAETSDLLPLLSDSETALAELKGQGLDKDALAAVENEIRVLASAKAKEFIRKVIGAPISSEDPAFAQDKDLLRDLFAMKEARLEDLPFSIQRTLDLLYPVFTSSFARTVLAVRRYWRENNGHPARIRSMAEELATLETAELVPALKKHLKDHQAAVAKYTALTTSSALPASDEEDDHTPDPAELFPPNLATEIQARLNRLCMSMFLGKQFLEQHSGALADNLAKLATFLDIVAGDSEFGLVAELSPGQAGTLRDVSRNLKTAFDAVQGREPHSRAEDATYILQDSTYKAVEEAMSSPLFKIPDLKMKADSKFLKSLLGDDLTLDSLFQTPGRLVLYLNSALESKEMKIAVSRFIKPVYFAVAALSKRHPELAGLSTNDLLRNNEAADATLGIIRKDHPDDETRKDVKNARQGLSNIANKTIQEIVSQLKNSKFKTSSEALERDMVLVESLRIFGRGPLGNLKLDARRTGLLLLLFLESFISEDLKALFESGSIQEKNSKQIIAQLQAKLQWHLGVVRAYNKQAKDRPKPKPR